MDSSSCVRKVNLLFNVTFDYFYAPVAKSPTALYHGSMGAMSATFVGHYPWFVTYNTLQEKVPTPDGTAQKLVRNAGIGFAASLASDTTSNSLRVLKVTVNDFLL